MKIAFALAAALLAAPAMAQEPAPSPIERDADYHNRQMLYLYSLKPSDGWVQTPSGLRYRRIKGSGEGPKPKPTDSVTIHYSGSFIDGKEFDSSIARGEPATFPLPRLVKGWQEAVPLMSVGDTFELAVPSHLGYGPKGRAIIPGGATLLFTIELFGIAEPQ